MSTANFKIEHRCIVVTNDDFEIDNVPETEKNLLSYDRNYPSSRLKGYNDDLLYHQICLTSGYYEAANIDYCDTGECIDDHLSAYSSKKEFFDAVMEQLINLNYYVGKKVSRYKLEKLCRGKKLELCADIVDEYLSDIEETYCNHILDGIKRTYGYEEYCTVCQFSNGETIYHKVN